jgi:two-component system response regulator DesR
MSAGKSSGNDASGRRPRTGRAPTVRVVAPHPEQLVPILELDGLQASTSARGRGSPDVVVLAIESLPAGAAAIGAARTKHPSARLVLLLQEATPAEARQLLVDDVPGLVLASQAEIALSVAVRAAFAGQICYPAELMPTQLRTALSNREKQILGMVVMGFSNPEIAAKLHLSESTVKSHLYSAFGTIGVRTRKDAVALILDPSSGFGAGILRITDTEQGADEGTRTG